MSIQIGVLTDNKHMVNSILKTVQEIYKSNKGNIDPISLLHIKQKQQALDYVNYEFPDYLIIDTSACKGDDLDLLNYINDDPWLHSTGIIIIYPESAAGYSKELSNLNILSYISETEINYLLNRLLKILLINKNTLVKRGITDSFLQQKIGSFTIDNDPSMVTSYVNIITTTLLNEKLINQSTENSIRITLTELIMNGIEHGNCELTYEEKSEFLENGGLINDLIALKNKDSKISSRKVCLDYKYSNEYIEFTIRDCGKGFNHAKTVYNPLNDVDLAKLNGRGIYLSKHFCHSIKYNDIGNEVTVIFKSDKSDKNFPKGFIDQKIIEVKPGDTVFQQNERSNSLFYIINGSYNVMLGDKIIATLDPSDIFLGEMAFLLNNKRVATIKAKTEGKLIELQKNTFINIVKQYPNYGLFLSKLLAKRLDKMNHTTYL